VKKVVLAYSGGLDTSVCIPWLAERGYEVVAYMADVGQRKDVRPAVRRAKIAGASKVVVRDLREEFVRDFVWPALRANALYEGRYVLATSLSRPLIAKELVRVAREEGAGAVAHGCTGKGNDQVRFEVTVQILDPALEILAPVREWDLRSREEEIAYAHDRGIPIDVTKKSPYSIDENLWGVSIEAGPLEDPWKAPPADCYVWTRGAEKRSPAPREVTIGFERGVPVSLDGRRPGALQLVARLNALAARYGIGRTDMVENRFVGIKSREIYEAPAATVLLAAHRDLESLVLDRALSQFKEELVPVYSRLIYNGFWYSGLRKALDAFIGESQKKVAGSVRVRFEKGAFAVNGRRSPHSLYREKLATYTSKDEFDQRLAKGFIDLDALPFKRPKK
jgi:argininosuccinate synthase